MAAKDNYCFWLAETAWWNWLIFDVEHPWKVFYKISPFQPNWTKTRQPNKSSFWLAYSLKNLLLWNFFAKCQVSNTGSALLASSLPWMNDYFYILISFWCQILHVLNVSVSHLRSSLWKSSSYVGNTICIHSEQNSEGKLLITWLHSKELSS